jgi:hypothetical protein
LFAVLVAAALVAVIVLSGGSATRKAVTGSHRVGQKNAAHGTRGGRGAQTPASHHAPGANHSAPNASPSGPVPAGFGPASLTAISDQTWWLLGTAPCASPPCTSIVRTDDGGASFVGIPAPRTDQVSQLRFADRSDGFAYGPQFWVTHDAGAHWHRADVGGSITDLAIADGYVYAIASSSASGKLLRAPVGGNHWVVLPGAGDASGGLWAHGSDVMLESGGAGRAGYEFLISHDSGGSFVSERVPPSVACQFEEQTAPVVWAHCATGMMSGVWRSSDYGHSFKAAGGVESPGGPALPNSAAFAATSSSTAVVGYNQLYRTTDGGISYAPVAGPAGITWWQYVGFTDSTHGFALGYKGPESPSNARLYYTTDAGHSYQLVQIR